MYSTYTHVHTLIQQWNCTYNKWKYIFSLLIGSLLDVHTQFISEHVILMVTSYISIFCIEKCEYLKQENRLMYSPVKWRV